MKKPIPVVLAFLAILVFSIASAGCEQLQPTVTPAPTQTPPPTPFLSPEASPSPTPFEPPTLVAHEWGVLLACSDANNAFTTNRPEQRELVKQPIVYFHNVSNDFNYSVEFLKGSATKTIPDVGVGKRVSWSASPAGAERKRLLTSRLVEVEEMLNALQTNSSQEIEVRGSRTRFLFYEGQTEFENEIETQSDGTTVFFKNNAGIYLACVE